MVWIRSLDGTLQGAVGGRSPPIVPAGTDRAPRAFIAFAVIVVLYPIGLG